MSTFTPLSKFFNICSDQGLYLDHILFSSISDFTNVTRLAMGTAQCFLPIDDRYPTYPLLFSFYPNSDYTNKMFGTTPTTASITSGGMLNMYRPIPKYIDTNIALYDFTSRRRSGLNDLYTQTISGSNYACPLKINNLIKSSIKADTIPLSVKNPITENTRCGFYNAPPNYQAQFSVPTELNLGINDFLFKTTFVIFSGLSGPSVFMSNKRGFTISVNPAGEIIVELKYGVYQYQSVTTAPTTVTSHFTLSGLRFNYIHTIEIYRVGSTFHGILFSDGIPGLGSFRIVSQGNFTPTGVDFLTMNFGEVFIGDPNAPGNFGWEIRHLTIMKNPYLNYLYLDPKGTGELLKNNYVSYDLTNFDNGCFAYNTSTRTICTCKDPTKGLTVDNSATLLGGTVHPVKVAPIDTSAAGANTQKWLVDAPTDGDQFYPYSTDGIWKADDGTYYYFVSDTLAPGNAEDEKIMEGSSITYTAILNVPNIFRKKGTCLFGGVTYPYKKVAYDVMVITGLPSMQFDFVTNTVKDADGKVFKYIVGVKRFIDMAGTWKTSPYADADILHFPCGSIGSTVGASYYNSVSKNNSMVYFVRDELKFSGSYLGMTSELDFTRLKITLGSKNFYKVDSPFLNTQLHESMLNVPFINTAYTITFDKTFYIINRTNASTVTSCGTYTFDTSLNHIIIGYSESGTNPVPAGTILNVSTDKTQISWPTGVIIKSGTLTWSSIGIFTGSPTTLSSPAPVTGTVEFARLRPKRNIWVLAQPHTTDQFILTMNFTNGYIDMNSTKNPPKFNYTILDFTVNASSFRTFSGGFSIEIAFNNISNSSLHLPAPLTLKFNVDSSDIYNTSLYTVELGDRAIDVTTSGPNQPTPIPSGSVFRFLTSTVFPLAIQNRFFSNNEYQIKLGADFKYSVSHKPNGTGTAVSTEGKYRFIENTNSIYFTNTATNPNTATYHDGIIMYNTQSLLVSNTPF